MRRLGGLLLVALIACAGLLGAASAGAEVRPLSEGGMSFPLIRGVTDPEDYSFSLELSSELELRQIDERHVGVFYSDDTLGYTLMATEAHDAQGAAVPTSLLISGPEVITLTVAHREGNPLAGGAPFTYPVTSGPGFNFGPGPVIVQGPPDEAELRASRERAAQAETPPPSSVTAAGAQRVFVTHALGEGKLVFRPHFFLLSGDGTFGVSKVQWQSYGGAVATATGRGFANDCIPYCAAGRFYHPQATLRLSKVVECQGKSVYARLRYALTGRLPEGFPRRGGFSMLPLGEDGKPDC